MGGAAAIRSLAWDPRTWVQLGLLTAVDDHDDWGVVLRGVLVGSGAEWEARPWYVGLGDGSGLYFPWEIGQEVVLLCPGGDVNDAIAIGGAATRPQRPEGAWHQAQQRHVRVTHAGGLEVRTAGTASVEPVVTADVAESLATLADAVVSIGVALNGFLPGAVDPATLTTVGRLALELRAGAYASPALRAQAAPVPEVPDYELPEPPEPP